MIVPVMVMVTAAFGVFVVAVMRHFDGVVDEDDLAGGWLLSNGLCGVVLRIGG